MDTRTAAPKLRTKGIRPRPDQIDKLTELMKLDPELTWSIAIRSGLDLFINSRMGQIAQTHPQVFRSISASLTQPHRKSAARAKQLQATR